MKKQDFILIGVILAASAILLFFLYGPLSGSGNYVKVEIDGKTVQTLRLDNDTEQQISTDYGTNTLVIKNGEASVTNADCPDRICVNHRGIRRSGESIICLPHKLVITIVNDKDENEVDLKS